MVHSFAPRHRIIRPVCGIGGILRTDGQPIPEQWLDIIDARIAYRGPDGHGRFRDRVEIDDPNSPGGKRIVEVAFVHRRLSIIDHEGGHQPMVSERGRNEKEGLVAVVFNGCIYNHRELRRELESKGHTFVTDHSDTEVLIHGWREWGEDLPDHLEGMYAYALWDHMQGWLTLSRDVFGEKPLYCATHIGPTLIDFDDCFVFASDVEAISFDNFRTCAFGRHNISKYLSLGYWRSGRLWTQEQIGGSNTTMRSVAPEESLAATADSGLVSLDSDPFGRWRDAPNAPADAAGFEQLLEQAVHRRLEADVPLGCFLSGGVDSSLIALLAKRHKPDLRTFTVRMPDARYDESAYAERVADSLGIEHVSLDVAMQPASDLVFLIETLGQPFGDSSILPTYWVSRAARQYVKVALAGDGGDELFLGYERYLAARTLVKYWRLLAHIPRSLLHRGHPKSLIHKLSRLGEMARDFPETGIEAMQAVFSSNEIDDLLEKSSSDRSTARKAFLGEWRAARKAAGFSFKHTPNSGAFRDALRRGIRIGIAEHTFQNDGLEELRAEDVHGYLPDDLLRKVDIASMTCGLEVRCPFLDRDLARAALSAPIEQLMPGGQRKGLLRQIARKYLPKEIVDRPKMGFAIPIGEWFRSDYGGMKTLLLDHLNSAEPFGSLALSREAVHRFIDEHMSGKRDHGQRLFTLLTLSIWARQTGKRMHDVAST